MSTLQHAINAESSTSSDQKSAELNILSDNVKSLGQSEIKSILDGNFDEFHNVTLKDVQGIRKLIQYRINNNLPILPFDFDEDFQVDIIF